MNKYCSKIIAIGSCVIFASSMASAQMLKNDSSDISSTNEAVNNEISVKKYNDWNVRCVTMTPQNKDNQVPQCEILRIAQMQEADIAVTILTISLTMVPDENGKQQVAMTNIGPLNIYLPEQLEYQIDGKTVLKTPFNTCNQAGCWSQQLLDKETLNALRKGKIAQAKFRMINGQPATVEFTLKGISAALDELGKNAK